MATPPGATSQQRLRKTAACAHHAKATEYLPLGGPYVATESCCVHTSTLPQFVSLDLQKVLVKLPGSGNFAGFEALGEKSEVSVTALTEAELGLELIPPDSLSLLLSLCVFYQQNAQQ